VYAFPSLEEFAGRWCTGVARIVRGAARAFCWDGKPIVSVARPRTLMAMLGNAVTLITVLAPPIGYALVSAYQLESRAHEHAAVGARQLELLLLAQGSAKQLPEVSSHVLLAIGAASDTVVSCWITDTNNRTIGFVGRLHSWPQFEIHAPIRGIGFNGHFNIAVSTRSIFMGTLHVGLAFLLLGLAAHYCFRRLPLAALDEALGLLQRNQAELQERNVRFDAALEHMSQGLCLFDAEQRILVCNRQYADMYGLTSEQVKQGTTLRQIVEHRIANGFFAGTSPEGYLEERTAPVKSASSIVQELSDGRFISVVRRPMASGGWVTTHEDVTERRRAEAKIAYMAHHDALTGLPNRVQLRQKLDQALLRVHRGEQLAVHCLDLDRFKEVNDTLGHAVGDELLKEVAARLQGCVGDSGTVARVSGDEFFIVQVPVIDRGEVLALAGRITSALNEPMLVSGHQVMIGTSVGIAVAPGDGREPEALLRHADLALYQAKRAGRGVHRFFEPGMNSRMHARRELELALHHALSAGEFEVYYQPMLNLDRNEISGFEALLRWHRGGTMVSPADFIPLAEETGLIVPIGEWVLRSACAEAATWPDPIAISVNLSTAQFRNPRLVATVVSALASSGLPASRLELEITESVLMQDNAQALVMLKELRALGVRIALDDFGTGYSALGYLNSFPLDKIKIDRSFIRDLAGGNESARAIVGAIVQLGNTLGMATTAEGVETDAQLAMVREAGCTEMQGFLLSPPKPAGEVSDRFFVDPERSRSVAVA
jgi:diguanylate cyclase (GGDEF)-like protein/PAS domain S-box-containing protein